MKNKIIGMVVCMLLLSPVVPIAGAMNFQTLWSLKNNSNSVPYITTDSSKITVKIVATITEVSDSYDLLGGAIHVSDTITGKYIYKTGVPDSEPNAEVGCYWYASSPCGIEINAGGFVFKTDPSNPQFMIVIYNDFDYYGNPAFDSYQVCSVKSQALSNGVLVDIIAWELDDATATALSSTDLPTTAPVLAAWNSGNELVIQGKDPVDSHKSYTITARVTEATKNVAINVFGTERGTPSMMLPTHNNIPFIQLWVRILERFPNAFPMLRYLLGYK
jgi:hypothetical protein